MRCRRSARSPRSATFFKFPHSFRGKRICSLPSGRSGRVVNIKKGQFLSPQEIGNAAEKVAGTGNEKIILTERGTSFGYQNLVVDMRSFPIMRKFGYPVVFDVTHSVQLPGGEGKSSGGQPEFIEPLARAGTAAGVDGIFLEVHENPAKALSDGTNALPLEPISSAARKTPAPCALVREWDSPKEAVPPAAAGKKHHEFSESDRQCEAPRPLPASAKKPSAVASAARKKIIEPEHRQAALATAKRVLRIEAEAIAGLIDRLDARFEEAVELLYACKGRVVVTGLGKSGLDRKKNRRDVCQHRHAFVFSARRRSAARRSRHADARATFCWRFHRAAKPKNWSSCSKREAPGHPPDHADREAAARRWPRRATSCSISP